MIFGILVALACLLIQPSIHHYIGSLDECTASKVCNHTWTPVCGNLAADSSNRLFLDDCDLHEYNCENNTTYVEVDSQICSAKCTQRDQPQNATTPMPPSSQPPKTTEETKSTGQTTESITRAQVTTQQTETTDNDNIKTPKDITTVNEEVSELKSSKKDENNINVDENTIPEETTDPLNTTISVTTTQKINTNPGCPPHCSLPSTWETTAVGETRDFIQILKERYGDRVKILKDTTHYPKNPMYARKRLAFIPGYHIERQKHRY